MQTRLCRTECFRAG